MTALGESVLAQAEDPASYVVVAEVSDIGQLQISATADMVDGNDLTLRADADGNIIGTN